MNTLKPCPFCGGTKICTEKGINLNYCDNCSAESNVERWNTRPIEARAEKAEAMVEKLIEAGRMMKQPETIEEFHRGRRDYNALVAKWKEQK